MHEGFPQHILCPVDFSEASAAALSLAARLAHSSPARLTVFYAHSFEPPAYFTPGDMDAFTAQFRESLRESRKALEQFTAENAPGVAADYVVRETRPAFSILDIARETGADLIAMGTHGRGGMGRMILGSVAENVVRESRIPVLTVRRSQADGHAAIRHILVPVNDTALARESLRIATRLANQSGASVTALHVTEPHAGAQSIGNLCEWLGGEKAPCEVMEMKRHGNAAEEIVTAARESKADVIVVGARHRPFFDTTVIGGTTMRVVGHAPCPVLTVVGE